MTERSTRPQLAIVGLGPRGISVIERLAALLPADAQLDLQLIDDAQHGAGRIWETTQTRTLCMNTLSGAVTLFTEPGASVKAPVLEGPILHEWIQLLRGERAGIADAKVELFLAHPPQEDLSNFAEEMATTLPQSNPSRALYGAYLRWVFQVARALLPAGVHVYQHHARALSIQEMGGRDVLTLSDGSTVTADASILATGWQLPGPTESEREFAEAAAAAGITWIAPDNPIEQNMDAIAHRGTVLARGLGMGFFDVMALLTLDRGGRFVEDAAARSGLRYEPSGHEPHVVVTSRRGYPFLPKSEWGGLPPAAALPRLKAVIANLSNASLSNANLSNATRIDYDTEVWPAVIKDAYEAYYLTLARVSPQKLLVDVASAEREIHQAIADVQITADLSTSDLALARLSSSPLQLSYWLDPLYGVSGPRARISEHIAQAMTRDIHEATLGADSPLKAALWSISASRKPISILGAQDRYTLESRNHLYAATMALGQMVGSGPPLFRTRQLLALVDAGLVSFLGADPQITVDIPAGLVRAHSPSTNGEEVVSEVLIDAWMHNPDIRRPADPLAASLVSSGRVRPYRLSTSAGHYTDSGSPEVDPNTRATVRADGSCDPRIHIIGIPTWAQLPDTTISPMPGTDPLMLQETDQAARHAWDILHTASRR